jgi:hypothetical protein
MMSDAAKALPGEKDVASRDIVELVADALAVTAAN